MNLLITLVLAVPAAVYVRRWRRVRRAGHSAYAARLLAFGAGLLALLIALASPVAMLAEQMFLWHMVQHILLVDLAPVLLLAGMSATLLEPVTARARRFERLLRILALPSVGVILYGGMLWLWHAPALYNAALTHSGVHALQHVTFLAVGLAFWWHVFGPSRAHRHVRGPGVFTFMAATKFATGVLAGLLVFLPERGFVYDAYLSQPRMWGLSAASDQQLGGSIMVVEELTLMTVAFWFMFVRMLAQADEDDEREEHHAAAMTAGDGDAKLASRAMT